MTMTPNFKGDETTKNNEGFAWGELIKAPNTEECAKMVLAGVAIAVLAMSMLFGDPAELEKKPKSQKSANVKSNK